MTLVRRWFAIVLWKRILGAMVLGAIAGFILGEQVQHLRWLGDLFIRLIRMLIVPLIFVTLVSGITSMSDPKRIASIGGTAMAFYLATSVIAVTIGISIALILQPGSAVDLSAAQALELDPPMTIGERLMTIVPDNVFGSFASGDVLAIIFFSTMLGAGIVMAGERGAPIARAFQSGSEVILKVTGVVMEVAPFGVFALVAWVMGTEGPGAFVNILMLTICVYLGGLIHMVVIQAGMARLWGRMSIPDFFRRARAPQLVAYSTSSSAATMPVTLSTAEQKFRVGPPVASSLIPLGTTINMDGTAIYVAAVAVFAAQIFGIELSAGDYVAIGITTTLVSIGAASVPSASLFLMAAVLESIGISPAQAALVIGFLLPFDRLLDMWRTVVNVTGDLAICRVIAKWEGELLPEEEFPAEGESLAESEPRAN